MAYRIRFSGISHTGLCRKENQDNFVCAGNFMALQKELSTIITGQITPAANAVFGIFDGMGGTQYGEKASRIAAENASQLHIRKKLIPSLEEYCTRTNAEICRLSNHAGTTAAMLVFAPRQIGLCNIGDTKIYRISGSHMEQISQDHVIRLSKTATFLTRNLGISVLEMPLRPYFARGQYQKGDQYLICSDGLTDMLSTAEILQIITAYPLENAVDILLKAALNRGGTDNISIILCQIEKQSKKRRAEKCRT